MTTETVKQCANCKHLGKIYFPPTIIDDLEFDAVYFDGCFLFAYEKQVMNLDNLETACECFEERGKKE